jgi:hypothetical protein
MKKAIYIHGTPARKSSVNIIMEPWPEGGLSDQEIEEEALALRLWMGEYLPGSVFDKVFEREGLEEIPGRIDIPIKRAENLSEIHKGNFSAAIIFPAPLPVRDERNNTVSLKDNPGPLRLRLTIEEKTPEGEGSEDRIRKTAGELVDFLQQTKEIFLYQSPEVERLIKDLASALEEGEPGFR